ncbi:hypothetical protein [Wenyingzhuangia sp. IMCC45574]
MVFITDFIRIDLLATIGVYSLFYFLLLPFFRKNQQLKAFDANAIQVVIYGGVLWIVLFSLEMFFWLLTNESQYWFVIWIQGVFWFLASQLLRIQFVQKYLFPRFLVAVLLLVNLEIFDIIVILLSKGRLPSTWMRADGVVWDVYLGEFILGFLFKICLFLSVVFLYAFVKERVRSKAVK